MGTRTTSSIDTPSIMEQACHTYIHIQDLTRLSAMEYVADLRQHLAGYLGKAAAAGDDHAATAIKALLLSLE